MTSTRSLSKARRASSLFSTGTPVIATLLFTCLLLGPQSVRAGDWVTFVDETATRLSADTGVGLTDPEEKDIATGDVDKDGDVDVIVVRKTPFTNAGGHRNVLFMNENGVMTDRSATLAPDFLDATDDREVALADVDGDTWLDIITAGTFDEQPRILMNLGEAAGVWQGFDYQAARMPVLTSATGNGPKFCGLGVGDVTGDDRPEIYFTDYENDMEDRLLINDGTGFFSDETSTRLTAAMVESTFGTDADIADINGDTFNDIVKDDASGSMGGNQPTVSIFYNDGSGNFTFKDDIYTEAPYMVALADFTQDGRLDLVIVDDAQDSYLINTGNDAQGHAEFTTQLVTGPNTQFFGGNVEFADLDNDTILDIMISDVDTDIDGCDRQLVLLQGQGTPPNISFADPLAGAGRAWTPPGTYDVAAIDINNDGALDLFAGTCTGIKIFMGIPEVVPSLFADGFESGDISAWSDVVP